MGWTRDPEKSGSLIQGPDPDPQQCYARVEDMRILSVAHI